MFQVIEAVIAVTVIAELSICKTVTVAIEGKQKNPPFNKTMSTVIWFSNIKSLSAS